MGSDISRKTFDRTKHYSAVRMQQGRVQLDADWNEQQAINQYRLDGTAHDVIGGCGAPGDRPGFGIMVDTTSLSADLKQQLTAAGILPLTQPDLLIGRGRYYVDGILCENDQVVSFRNQPDLPQALPATAAGVYVVFLDVWPRELTALDDPSIREKALGGPDTAARVKTVWQVKLARVGPVGMDIDCAGLDTSWQPPVGTGQLQARVAAVSSSTDPCILPPTGGYRRLENQLYRIEVHQGGPRATATFKWSRENGSVVAAIDNIASDLVTLDSLSRDEALGFNINQWVEIVDDQRELSQPPGDLVQIKSIDPARPQLTLTAPHANVNSNLHPKLRRWDQSGPGLTANGVPMTNTWVPLENDGVEIMFSDGTYRTGDYWLIPARTAVGGQLGGIEWPVDGAQNPIPQSPDGVPHHYCPLALVELNQGRYRLIQDCRNVFDPLTDGMQVIKVLVKGAYGQQVVLQNGMQVQADNLAQGLAVMMNQNIDPSSVVDATCAVTLEIPFPNNDADYKVWGTPTIGYYPLILAGGMKAGNTGRDLLWTPLSVTQQLLQNGLPSNLRRRVASEFSHDWGVSNLTGTGSNWNYGNGDTVKQDAQGVGGFGTSTQLSIGTIAVSQTPLSDNAQYLGATANFGYSGVAGLVFNRTSSQDYYVYVCRYYSVSIGFSGGYTALAVSLAHVQNGAVVSLRNREIGQSSIADEISLDITQTSTNLVFGGQCKAHFPPAGNQFIINIAPGTFDIAPPKFVSGSTVGLLDTLTNAEFTRLQVVYPNGTTTLIPPAGSNRILAHFTLKRDFIQPAITPYTAYPPQFGGPAKPQADFEQWFWLTPPTPRYGYGGYQGFSGIGGSKL